MRSTQKKFEQMLEKGCEDRDYELVADYAYANTGIYRIQEKEKIKSKLILNFSWQDGYVSLTTIPEVRGLRSYIKAHEVQESLETILKFLEVGNVR